MASFTTTVLYSAMRLQVLKRIFEMGSAKSACYRTGVFWAAKSVMNYRDEHRASWYNDSIDVRPGCNWINPTESTSPFHALLARLDVSVTRLRSLRSVTHARQRVNVGDWILTQSESSTTSVIGRVRDIVQAEQHTGSDARAVVRMWLDGCVDPRYGVHGEIWAVKPDFTKCLLVEYECTHVSVLIRSTHDEHDVYIL